MTAAKKLLPGIVWFALTFFLLTLPGNKLPNNNWMDGLQLDKFIHVFLFCVLVLCWVWGIVSTKPQLGIKKTILVLAITALVYGIAMEFVQKNWIANRSFDIWDIVADGVGCFLPLFFRRRFIKTPGV